VLSLACWLTAAAAACAGGSAPAAPGPAAPGPAEPVQVALRDLAGKEWVLQSWDADEAAPASPRVTLTYKDDRFSGRSGCNQYFTSVTPGAEPGQLVVGAIASTKMACAQPILAVESRFQQQLGQVTRFALRDGKLALAYAKKDASDGMMLFVVGDTAAPR